MPETGEWVRRNRRPPWDDLELKLDSTGLRIGFASPAIPRSSNSMWSTLAASRSIRVAVISATARRPRRSGSALDRNRGGGGDGLAAVATRGIQPARVQKSKRGGGLINLLEPAPRAGIVGRMVELVEACGALPGVLDTFLLGRLLKGWRPSQFIEGELAPVLRKAEKKAS